jgi:hypothetical protein
MTATFKTPESAFGGKRTIVGVGFCLKPTDPPCPSGRSNHDCQYFEAPPQLLDNDIPEPCRQCAIREIGEKALRSGSAFYIMTSARDILFDVFIPALNKDHFSTGLFALCRYSFEPFAVGLLASGIQGRLFPYKSGDCADYRTWLQADRGIKDDQTFTSDQIHEKIIGILKNAEKETASPIKIHRQGNILYPEEKMEMK